MERNYTLGVVLKCVARSIGIYWPVTLGLSAYYTRDRAKLLMRIAGVAVAGEIPFYLLTGSWGNDVFVLGIGVALTYLVDRDLGVLALLLAGGIWSATGKCQLYLVVPVAVYWMMKLEVAINKRDVVLLGLVVLNAYCGTWPYDLFFGVGLIVMRGALEVKWRAPQWLRYGFFPLHYSALVLIRSLL